MPFGATYSKQTHHQVIPALGGVIKLLPHHAKPFRRRHVLLLMVSLVFAGSLILELATITTKQSFDPRALFSAASPTDLGVKTVKVRSSNGFSFAFNPELFTANVQSNSLNGAIGDAALARNSPLDAVTITPLPSRVPAQEAAAELQVIVESDAAAFAAYKLQPRPKTDITAITADYFAPKSNNLASVREETRTTEVINGSLMTKSIYVIEPKFAGNPTRTIIWTTQVQTRPLAISIKGIVNGDTVPGSFALILQSMELETDIKVKGLSFFASKPQSQTLEQKYIADLVSPAVVKIYHMVCGSLVYDGKTLSSDSCSGTTGSGFIVSADGYIATNGHVVVYGAKDMLVNALLGDKALLEQFLLGSRLSATQVKEVIKRPDLTASVVSGIYDIPDSRLRLVNQRELTVVATGSEPFGVKNEREVKQAMNNFRPTDSLKQATVIGSDYAAQDQLTVLSDPTKGFSSSDVALLKINQSNSPLIALRKESPTQNQAITLFGFPGDADNQLTDNTSLGVTVTNGNISAIRDAAGSSSKLFQSDADASHGSSGGPAIDEYGEAFGLLTYRFSSNSSGDAAKSYIRDIKDFRDLLSSKNTILNAESQTQSNWREGLYLYGGHHYSEALKKFVAVQQLYPSHRLVETYIDQSRQAIAEGRDINDPPALLILLGIGIGLGGLGAAVIMIARHYGRHQVYRTHRQRHTALAHSH